MTCKEATLCSILNEFTIFQQSVKDEEWISEVLLLYFQHQRESENCYFYTILPTSFTHLLAIYDKESATSRSKLLFSSTNTSAKTSLIVWHWHLLMVFQKFVQRNSVKFAPIVARGNSWRKWVVVTSLLNEYA